MLQQVIYNTIIIRLYVWLPFVTIYIELSILETKPSLSYLLCIILSTMASGPPLLEFMVEASNQGHYRPRGASSSSVPVVINVLRNGPHLPHFKDSEFTFNVREDAQPGTLYRPLLFKYTKNNGLSLIYLNYPFL